MNTTCFIVRNNAGQALGYFYFEDEPGRRLAAKLLTEDEARWLAINFANCRTYRAEKHGDRRRWRRRVFPSVAGSAPRGCRR